MFNLGFGEILVICVVLIIVVGPERLPSLMKTVGKAMRTVRQASREIQSTVGLDEILRDDVMYPMPVRAPVPPPAATVSRDAPVPTTTAPLAAETPPAPEAQPPVESATHPSASTTAPTAPASREAPAAGPKSDAPSGVTAPASSQHLGTAGGEKGPE